MKTKLNRILLIFVLFLSVTFILNSTGNQTEPTEPQDLSPQSIEIKQGSPKMEHVLYRLMKTYYGQGIEKAKEFADRRGITIKNNNVRVVTEAKIKNDFQEETTTKDTGAVSDIKGANYLISE